MIACAALALAVGVQTWRCERLASARSEAIGQLADAEASVVRLSASIYAQNASLVLFKTDRDTAAAALTVAEARAGRVAAINLRRAADLAVYTPKGADFCTQLVDLDREINP